jgi:polar amino acid transport system ATP-binding protein
MTAPSTDPSTAGPLLVCEGVHKAYGAKQVLTGLSLAVEPHAVVCLIGPSGSGKSTLLRCIDLLERIDGGRILLGGQDITARRVDGNAVRRRMGMVF